MQKVLLQCRCQNVRSNFRKASDGEQHRVSLLAPRRMQKTLTHYEQMVRQSIYVDVIHFTYYKKTPDSTPMLCNADPWLYEDLSTGYMIALLGLGRRHETCTHLTRPLRCLYQYLSRLCAKSGLGFQSSKCSLCFS